MNLEDLDIPLGGAKDETDLDFLNDLSPSILKASKDNHNNDSFDLDELDDLLSSENAKPKTSSTTISKLNITPLDTATTEGATTEAEFMDWLMNESPKAKSSESLEKSKLNDYSFDLEEDTPTKTQLAFRVSSLDRLLDLSPVGTPLTKEQSSPLPGAAFNLNPGAIKEKNVDNINGNSSVKIESKSNNNNNNNNPTTIILSPKEFIKENTLATKISPLVPTNIESKKDNTSTPRDNKSPKLKLDENAILTSPPKYPPMTPSQDGIGFDSKTAVLAIDRDVIDAFMDKDTALKTLHENLNSSDERNPDLIRRCCKSLGFIPEDVRGMVWATLLCKTTDSSIDLHKGSLIISESEMKIIKADSVTVCKDIALPVEDEMISIIATFCVNHGIKYESSLNLHNLVAPLLVTAIPSADIYHCLDNLYNAPQFIILGSVKEPFCEHFMFDLLLVYFDPLLQRYLSGICVDWAKPLEFGGIIPTGWLLSMGVDLTQKVGPYRLLKLWDANIIYDLPYLGLFLTLAIMVQISDILLTLTEHEEIKALLLSQVTKLTEENELNATLKLALEYIEATPYSYLRKLRVLRCENNGFRMFGSDGSLTVISKQHGMKRLNAFLESHIKGTSGVSADGATLLEKWEGRELELENILKEKYEVPGVMTLSLDGIDLFKWIELRYMCVSVSPKEVFPQLVSIGRKDRKSINPSAESKKNLPFFVIDLRSQKEREAGRFGKAWPFDPDNLGDAENIQEFLEILAPMTSVHVAIMSSYGTLLEVNAMVMHLYCKGFKRVSIVEGGFLALHNVAQEKGVLTSGGLVDHNKKKCRGCHPDLAASVNSPVKSRANSGDIVGAAYGNFDKNEKWFEVPGWASGTGEALSKVKDGLFAKRTSIPSTSTDVLPVVQPIKNLEFTIGGDDDDGDDKPKSLTEKSIPVVEKPAEVEHKQESGGGWWGSKKGSVPEMPKKVPEVVIKPSTPAGKTIDPKVPTPSSSNSNAPTSWWNITTKPNEVNLIKHNTTLTPTTASTKEKAPSFSDSPIIPLPNVAPVKSKIVGWFTKSSIDSPKIEHANADDFFSQAASMPPVVIASTTPNDSTKTIEVEKEKVIAKLGNWFKKVGETFSVKQERPFDLESFSEAEVYQLPRLEIENVFAHIKKDDIFTYFGQDSVHLYNAIREFPEENGSLAYQLPIVVSLSSRHLLLLDIKGNLVEEVGGGEIDLLRERKKETRTLHVKHHWGLELIKKIVYKKSEKEKIKIGIELGEEMKMIDLTIKECDEFHKLLNISVRSVKDSLPPPSKFLNA